MTRTVRETPPSLSITLFEQLLHVPCCHPTALQSWHSPCGGCGATRASGHSQLIPRNSALLALPSCTERLHCSSVVGLETANLQHPALHFSLSTEKFQLFSATWNKKRHQLARQKVPCFQQSIPPAQCIHKHTTHTTVGTALKKSHSATPGSASKGNVNVKGKVLLACGISII